MSNSEFFGVFGSFLAVGIVMALVLYACDPGPSDVCTTMHVAKAAVPDTTCRFSVERVGRFDDGMAYNGKRGIYVITDGQTGQQFVGVSGIGIAELGDHRNGKATHSDER